jgi:putative transposase
MGAVHVLPGTTQSSTIEKGDYDSSKHAALTLSEFEDWLHLEICRYHNTRHAALGRTPLAAWADLGGNEAGRQVIDVDAFRMSFMPFEWRQLGRTGISLFSVGYWSDAFASMLGRGQGKMMVKYDPRDLSQIWVIDEDGHVIVARYRDLSHPRISLWESRRARKEWQDKNIGRMTEGALFRIIDAQRRLAETARQQTRSARLDVERDVRQPKNKTQRDPSREMFAIDTGNPDLPTYPIDDFDDSKQKN